MEPLGEEVLKKKWERTQYFCGFCYKERERGEMVTEFMQRVNPCDCGHKDYAPFEASFASPELLKLISFLHGKPEFHGKVFEPIKQG